MRIAMKRIMWSVGILLLFASVTALWYFQFNSTSPRMNSIGIMEKTEKGSGEDPEARARWEWKRVRSPYTNSVPENIRAKELAFAQSIPTKEEFARSSLQKGQAAQLFTWSRRGPANVGGRTRALAIDVSNESIILAGGVSGGMWRSTDGGASWTRATSLAIDNQSVTCLTQDTRSAKTNIWYYGTGEYSGSSGSGVGAFYSGDGIFKSTDGGVNWSVLSTTSTGIPQSFDNFFDYVWNVATDPSNAAQDEVYAATYGALFRSTNGGTSWAATRGGSPTYSPFVDVAVTSAGVVYATLSSESTTKGIWRSTDGVTWANITPAGFPSTYRRIVIGIAPSDEAQVYFLAETPSGGTLNHSFWKYTYLSGDGTGAGGSWVNRSANMPAFGAPVGDFDSQASYDLIVKVKPDNADVVFLGGTNLYRSTDGYATTGNTTWIGGYATANNVSSYANQHADQHSMAFLPSNASVLFAGHDGGISKTTNNLASTVSWSFLNNGYYSTQFYTVAIDHATSGNNVIVGGMQDNGTWRVNSTSGTAAWSGPFSIGGDGAYCAVADGRTFYYVSSQNGNVYRYTLDGGFAEATWTKVVPTGAANFLFVNPLVLDPNNSNVMYLAGGDRVWRNSDLSAIPNFSNSTTAVNWSQFSNAVLSGEALASFGIGKTASGGGASTRLYFGTDVGNVYRFDNASNTSSTATDVTGANFPSSAPYVSCLAVNPANDNEVIAVFSNYEVQSLFYTTNGGTSWTNVSGNMEAPPFDGSGDGPSCRWAAIVPTTQGTTYFVGTSVGLYSATALSGSTTWVQEGASTIGNVIVDMIDFRTSDGLVVVGTHANGVFSTNVVVSTPRAENTLPTGYVLNQNYPNPFNPSTTIRYSLPERSHVKITVFDAAGREISILRNREENAGKHEVQWDAKDAHGISVASGVYFYTLTALGEGSEVKFTRSEKMTLVK